MHVSSEHSFIRSIFVNQVNDTMLSAKDWEVQQLDGNTEQKVKKSIIKILYNEGKI